MNYYYKLIKDEDVKSFIKFQMIIMWVPILGGVMAIIMMQILLFKRASEKIVTFDLAVILAVVVLAVLFFLFRSMINPITGLIFYLAALAFLMYPAAYFGIASETKIMYELQEEDRKNRPVLSPDLTPADIQPVAVATEKPRQETPAKAYHDTAKAAAPEEKSAGGKAQKKRFSFPAFFRAVPQKIASVLPRKNIAGHEDETINAVVLYITAERLQILKEHGFDIDFSLFWVIDDGSRKSEIMESRPVLQEGYACYFRLSMSRGESKNTLVFKLSEIREGKQTLASRRIYHQADSITETIEKYLG